MPNHTLHQTHPSEAEAFLLSLPRFATAGASAMKPGLERISALLEGMGRPQDRYPTVLIGGTNGKGSVASMVAAIATAAGRRTGLHTSPHLTSVRERMRVDGAPVPAEWLDAAVARYRSLFDEVEASFFEVTVALSLLYFADAEVDHAVVEVGLGGRLDATNVLEPRLSIVTAIGLDHQEILGGSLEAIAREKAGIARRGRTLLTSVEPGPVLDALVAAATERGAVVEPVRQSVRLEITRSDAAGIALDLTTPRRHYGALEVALPGDHHAWNAALAVRAWEEVAPEVLATEEQERALRSGLASVRAFAGLRGRSEVLAERPFLIADVAHNADGLAAALALLRRLAPGDRGVVLGLMADKRPEQVGRLLAAPDLNVWTVTLPGQRGLAAGELARHLAAAGANVTAAESVHAVVRRFRRAGHAHDGLLVTGSHQIVAEVLARREPAVS